MILVFSFSDKWECGEQWTPHQVEWQSSMHTKRRLFPVVANGLFVNVPQLRRDALRWLNWRNQVWLDDELQEATWVVEMRERFAAMNWRKA